MSGIGTGSPTQRNYYRILNLPAPRNHDEPPPQNDILKAAYRRALLLYHPDKATAQQSKSHEYHSQPSQHGFTVDQIVQAYEVLANPITRSAYDKELIQFEKRAQLLRQKKGNAIVGIDLLDLEDLDYDGASQVWSRKCRCGGTYQVTDGQLEDVAADGEITLGCHGCSLSIGVVFDTVEV